MIESFGKEEVRYTMFTSKKKKIDSEVHPLIPRGVVIDGQKATISVDDSNILGNRKVGGNNGYFGSITGDGSSKQLIELYLGGYLAFTTPELVKIRISHISKGEAISLGQGLV